MKQINEETKKQVRSRSPSENKSPAQVKSKIKKKLPVVTLGKTSLSKHKKELKFDNLEDSSSKAS